MKKKFGTQKFLLAGLAILFIGFIAIIGLNQVDETLLPEIQKIENEFYLTESEKEGLDLALQSKELCEDRNLTDQAIESLFLITKKESYRIKTLQSSPHQCLFKLSLAFKYNGYLSNLNSLFIQNPELAVNRLSIYLGFMARTALKSDTLIARVLALEGIDSGLELAHLWKKKVPNIGSRIDLPDLQVLIKTSYQDYLISVRDSEMGVALRSFFNEDVIDRFQILEYPVLLGFWKYFYLPNKTKNAFWMILDFCIKNVCLATDQPSVSKFSLINPVGVGFVPSFKPNLEPSKIKIKMLLTKIAERKNQIGHL